MLVTPSYIFAVFIFERYLSHGAGEEFFIAPFPSIFSTPVSVSSVHVRLLPSPSAPQVPLTVSAFSATQSRQVSRAVIAAKNSSFPSFFMMFVLLFYKILECIQARKAEKIKKVPPQARRHCRILLAFVATLLV